MIPDAAQIAQDAVAIRGILELLAGPEPITTYEVALTQHVGDKAARRLLHMLERAGVIEHCPVEERYVLRALQPFLCWRMTEAARRGDVCVDAGILAERQA